MHIRRIAIAANHHVNWKENRRGTVESNRFKQ
jgi:hypothetical protein